MVDLPETSIILEPTSPSPFDASLFEGCCAVLYVVDITADYVLALTKLCALALRMCRSSPKLPIEVFLHKADNYEEHERQDVLRDISQKFREEMADLCDSPVDISFHLTSVFDQSIYDSLSRVVQKHVDEHAALESLLDLLCSVSFTQPTRPLTHPIPTDSGRIPRLTRPFYLTPPASSTLRRTLRPLAYAVLSWPAWSWTRSATLITSIVPEQGILIIRVAGRDP